MIGATAWLGYQLLTVGVVAVALTCGVLAGIVVGTKGVRDTLARRHERLLAPYRRSLLALAAGDPDDEERALLAGATRRSRPAVEAALLGLLTKVKGESVDDLVAALGGDAAVERAQRAARSRRAVRRGRAAVLLGRCGRRGVLPDLVLLLEDRDPNVRQAAATALGVLGDPDGARPLLRAVRAQHGRPRVPSGVVTDALVALDFGIEDALREGLHDPDPGVRSVAAAAAAERTSVALRPVLRERLPGESDRAAQVAGCLALGRTGDDTDVELLATIARDGATPSRLAAVAALGEIDSAACVPVLASLLGDADRRVAGAAARALGAMSLPGASRALLDAPEGPAARAAAFEVAVGRLRAGRPQEAVRA